MHLAPLIRDLAVILAVAGVVTLLFQKIRQPVVLGYLIAGLIVGPYTPPFPLIADIPNVQIWAEMGVIFLMFSLGLEFSFRRLAQVGVSASVTAGVEVVFMTALGFICAAILGWNKIDGLFLGAMLAISSTTIIIKALDELKLKTRRFAEVIFGVLIVEDLFAILILVGLTTIVSSGGFSGLTLLSAAGKLVLVVGGWVLAGYFLVPRYMRFVGRTGSNETLTVSAIALCLLLVVFAAYFHYSVALGAFIMGSILAETAEVHRIEKQIEPLRDLFAAVFFVSVGMLIDPRMIIENWQAVLLISVVTVVGKILSTGLGALLTGRGFKTSLQVGFGLAQIGEFSFIIASLGMTLGVTRPSLYPIGVAVSVITTFTTPYLIQSSQRLAGQIENKLPAKLRDALDRYAIWAEAPRDGHENRLLFQRRFTRWAINGLLVSVAFTVTRAEIFPWVRDRFDIASWGGITGWALAVFISAPFIWGMLSSFRGGIAGIQNGVAFVMHLLSLLWIGALSAEFIPASGAVLVTLALAAGFSILFYRQLETSYRWFEGQFLSTFEGSEEEEGGSEKRLRHLAPWDAHLVRLQLHPNAPWATKSLEELRLRKDHGLNVVAIQRGDRVLVAPKPREILLPFDELLVLGTDEKVDSVRSRIEKPAALENAAAQESDTLNEYKLKPIALDRDDPWVGTRIRDSGIRETYHSMVVGIERAGRRLINPDSDLVLEAGDVLWITGRNEDLSRVSESRPRSG